MLSILPIIIYFGIIVIYTLFYMFRRTSLSAIFSFIILCIAILIALLFNNSLAAYISNNIEFIRIRNDIGLLLGMEIIYYKVIAFVFLFVIVQVILTIIWNISKINSRVNYVDNKLITGVFALATSFIWATVLMAIFESSAYSMDYGTSLSETLSNPPIFGNILQTSLFDFSKMVEVVDANIEISSVEVDLAVLRYFESSGYVDKETMKSILNNYDAYSEDIQKWLSY